MSSCMIDSEFSSENDGSLLQINSKSKRKEIKITKPRNRAHKRRTKHNLPHIPTTTSFKQQILRLFFRNYFNRVWWVWLEETLQSATGTGWIGFSKAQGLFQVAYSWLFQLVHSAIVLQLIIILPLSSCFYKDHNYKRLESKPATPLFVKLLNPEACNFKPN